MSGKFGGQNLGPNKIAFSEMYMLQVEFQKRLSKEQNLPSDQPRWYQYHITAMVEELGEVLKADKRWKSHRNTSHDQTEKIDEIADVFITAMNIAIFSGVEPAAMRSAILEKIGTNFHRLDLEETK